MAQSPDGASASPKKRKQRNQSSVLSLEDKLESLMDKLAMWQLLRSIDDHGINSSSNGKPKDDRDWMQIFCEDVVRETFVHSQHFTRSSRYAYIRPGVLGSASYSQICATCFTPKFSDTLSFLKTRTRRLPHRTTRNEKQSAKRPYQLHRLILVNGP